MPHHTRIFAHRAGPEERHPDNSLAALQATLRRRVDGIEIDVRRSADGEYFVFHDRAVRRAGRFESVTSPRIRKIRLPNGEPVPSLAAFLSRTHSGVVFLDVKGRYPPREILDAALASMPIHRLIFGSFWHGLIREIKQLRPLAVCAVTVDAGLVDPVRAMQDAGADILALGDDFIDRRTVRSVHAGGGRVFAWTVNERARAAELSRMGVDAVITDFPSHLL